MRTVNQQTPSAYTPTAPPSVTIGATSAQILAAATTGKTRTVLRIQNTHATQKLWIREDGGTAAATAGGAHLMLGPGQGWDWAYSVPQGVITGISDGAATIVAVLVVEV